MVNTVVGYAERTNLASLLGFDEGEPGLVAGFEVGEGGVD